MMVGFAFPARRTLSSLLHAAAPFAPALQDPSSRHLDLDELLEHLVGGAGLHVSWVRRFR